jgi:hypothetical protein
MAVEAEAYPLVAIGAWHLASRRILLKRTVRSPPQVMQMLRHLGRCPGGSVLFGYQVGGGGEQRCTQIAMRSDKTFAFLSAPSSWSSPSPAANDIPL